MVRNCGQWSRRMGLTKTESSRSILSNRLFLLWAPHTLLYHCTFRFKAHRIGPATIKLSPLSFSFPFSYSAIVLSFPPRLFLLFHRLLLLFFLFFFHYYYYYYATAAFPFSFFSSSSSSSYLFGAPDVFYLYPYFVVRLLPVWSVLQ